MICGLFHEGSGLGDQLHRYITVRTLALDKGYEWGMIGDFKGVFFLEQPRIIGELAAPYSFEEKKVTENGVDIRSYDPEINFIKDGTIIDGCFEDEKYWGHRLGEIREWLMVEPLTIYENICVIGFRAGEYKTVPDLFLTKEYWKEAILEMIIRHPGIQFEVHTDDPETAREFFPIYPIIHDVGLNWRSVRYAKHLIISNSAFYIMPMLLGEAEDIIAPRYWARRNIKTWARPACYYKDKRIVYI